MQDVGFPAKTMDVGRAEAKTHRTSTLRFVGTLIKAIAAELIPEAGVNLKLGLVVVQEILERA
jgi:hypothetical protein